MNADKVRREGSAGKANHQQLMADADAVHAALQSAAGERHHRPGLDPATSEPGWVIFERDVVANEVNRIRARNGFSPISSADLLPSERSAVGHSDYVWKYALRAAELAHTPSI